MQPSRPQPQRGPGNSPGAGRGSALCPHSPPIELAPSTARPFTTTPPPTPVPRIAPNTTCAPFAAPSRDGAAARRPIRRSRRSRSWCRRCPRRCGSFRTGRGENSVSLVPGDAETHRGIDHADHAVGLRKVPPQLAAARVDMLREQTVAVAAAEYALEQRAGLVLASQRGQRVDIPEGADHEGVLRDAEVIRPAVAEQELPAAQVLLDGLDRGSEARVVGAQEIELVQEEQARVQVLAAESCGEAFALRVPGPAQIAECIASARSRQARARSASPIRAAILARRSHPAQHITLEKVWTRFAPRSSHGPASGWSNKAAARSPSCSSWRNSDSSLRSASRASKNTCAAARIAAP